MPRKQTESEIAWKIILNTLGYIKNNSDFAQLSAAYYGAIIPDQIRTVQAAHSRLLSSRPDKWQISIPILDIPIKDNQLVDRHNATVLLGGEIEALNGKIMRSCMSICITFTSAKGAYVLSPADSSRSLNIQSCCQHQCIDVKRVVRRFHFDYQPGDLGIPISHMQYGGKFPDRVGLTSNWHYCLEHFLENPRLHYPPMDLALLLDLALREFKTPLSKWTKQGQWNNLVLNSQGFWWRHYWESVGDHLKRDSTPTFHQFFYGN